MAIVSRTQKYFRWLASSLVPLLMAVLTGETLAATNAPEPISVRVVSQPEKGFPWEIFASGLLGLLSAIAAFFIQQAVQRRRKASEERETLIEMLRGICSELALNEEVLRELSGNVREGKLPSKRMSSLTYISFHPELVRLLKKPVLLHELQSVYHQFGYMGGFLDKIGQGDVVKLQMIQSITNVAGSQTESVAKLRPQIEAHINSLSAKTS